MDDIKVFQFIGNTVTGVTDAFVQPAVSSLISNLKLIIVTSVSLYLVFMGYAIITGLIESPLGTFIKQCLKIIMITFFALTTDGYLNGVIEALNGFETDLSQIFCQDDSFNGKQPSIYQVLDQSLNAGFSVVQCCVEQAHQAGFLSIGTTLGWYLTGLIVGLSTIYVNILGGTTIIVAQFSLMVMFSLGPLFIICLMFPVTARFFDNWFAQVMNYILTIVIMVIVMTFAIKAYGTFIEKTDFSGSGENNPITIALQVCTLSGVLGWIILQAGGMASGLAGGLSLTAMAIRQFAAPLAGNIQSFKSVAHVVNPQQTRLDMNTGATKPASRASHIIAGNTRLNPAYNQYIKERLTNNWGKAKGGTTKKT